MRNMVLALVVAAAVAASVLGLAAARGSPALAAGPAPGGTWEPPISPDPAYWECVTPSGAPGHWLVNTNTGKAHCFKD